MKRRKEKREASVRLEDVVTEWACLVEGCDAIANEPVYMQVYLGDSDVPKAAVEHGGLCQRHFVEANAGTEFDVEIRFITFKMPSKTASDRSSSGES